MPLRFAIDVVRSASDSSFCVLTAYEGLNIFASFKASSDCRGNEKCQNIKSSCLEIIIWWSEKCFGCGASFLWMRFPAHGLSQFAGADGLRGKMIFKDVVQMRMSWWDGIDVEMFTCEWSFYKSCESKLATCREHFYFPNAKLSSFVESNWKLKSYKMEIVSTLFIRRPFFTAIHFIAFYSSNFNQQKTRKWNQLKLKQKLENKQARERKSEQLIISKFSSWLRREIIFSFFALNQLLRIPKNASSDFGKFC